MQKGKGSELVGPCFADPATKYVAPGIDWSGLAGSEFVECHSPVPLQHRGG